MIYVGTFSRTVFPALRIGYLIVPKQLTSAFTTAKWLCDRHTATLEQRTLAEFISSGLYERCLRRLRKRNTLRREALLGAIQQHLGNRVEVTGDGSGTHLALWPRKRVSEDRVVAEAAKRGVGIYGMSRHYLGRPQRPGFVLGYTQLREEDIREGIQRLSEVL